MTNSGHYHDDIFQMKFALSVMAIAAEPEESARWIVTHEGDEGEEYCSDCGNARVAELREQFPDHKDDIYLDGGWNIQMDHHPFCCKCGTRLDGDPTDYCISEEISHFLENGFHCVNAEIAYEIEAIVSSFEYQFANESPERTKNRESARTLGRSYLELANYQENIEPGQWADDGGRCFEDHVDG